MLIIFIVNESFGKKQKKNDNKNSHYCRKCLPLLYIKAVVYTIGYHLLTIINFRTIKHKAQCRVHGVREARPILQGSKCHFYSHLTLNRRVIRVCLWYFRRGARLSHSAYS